MYEAAKYEAARVDDTIYHTSAFWGFLAGALLGLALCSLMIFFPCGFLAGLFIGAIASKLPEIGKKLGQKKKTPSGKIITGSPNVHINKKAAAYSGVKTEEYESRGSYVDCTKHPKSPPPQIAEGSKIVFITGQPAARKDDKTECDGTINEGSPNVHIGMEKQQYMPIDPEVPRWMEITAQVLMFVAGIAGAIRGLARLGISGLKAMAPCLGKVAGGMAAGYVLDQVLDKGLDAAIDGLLGSPVDTKRGRKVILPETDFVLSDVMPIVWSRFYASDLTHDSVLGQGWMLPWEQTLHKENDLIYLTDRQGRKEPFPIVKAGERIYLSSEKKFLLCTQGNHYVIQTLDNELYYFGELFEGQKAPLLRIENALGHFIHFTYEADKITDITSTGGHRLHLHYSHPKGRLTEVVRVVDCEAVETLVSYRYDSHGQLTGVINRNGDATRYFNYEKGLMISHQNGLGFKCEYRWQIINNEPRVVEHWTNDGEHYYLDYDIENRITKMTDALKREAEIHYNENYVTTYYKDFGGKEYHLELDQNDNIIGVKLPSGGEVSLKYDELSRLIEETDQIGRKFSYSYYKETELKTETVFPDGATWKAAYDEKGTLLFETDPIGNTTQYYNTEDGLPYAIIDALDKRKEIVWNKYGQVERYQDCSNKVTQYQYDQYLHLTSITNALGETTNFERKPQGEITCLTHADSIKETFTYNAMGQLLSHADGKGHTIYLSRNPRGLLIKRYDPKDQTITYQYDVAQRLTTLLNENNEAYHFHYDSSDRLIEEISIDGIRKKYGYNPAGYLASLTETGIDSVLNIAERTTYFEINQVGQLLNKSTEEATYSYNYDLMSQLIQIDRQPTAKGKKLEVTEDKVTFSYDLKGRLLQEETLQGKLDYHYDELDNLTSLTLPDGQKLNHQYYGSGHLHQISLDELLISDFERDDLHREILRTQGNLTSRFGYDAQGRRHWQYASKKPLEELTTLNTAHLLPLDQQIKSRDNAIFRQYQYDPAGELIALLDKTRGKTEYSYTENGQLQTVTTATRQEHFTSDAAGNFLPVQVLPAKKFTMHNRITDYGDIHLKYDKWGNVIEKSIGLIKHQTFNYDCENRLVKAQTSFF